MDTIELPQSVAMRRTGWLLIAVLTALVLACPVAWPWRAAAAGLVLAGGLGSGWRYLKRRPVVIECDRRGRLGCRLANQRVHQVVAVDLGVVRPWLVSARLRLAGGGGCDLFVPGWALSERDHWRLRRAVVGFRGPERPAGSKTTQSAGARGT